MLTIIILSIIILLYYAERPEQSSDGQRNLSEDKCWSRHLLEADPQNNPLRMKRIRETKQRAPSSLQVQLCMKYNKLYASTLTYIDTYNIIYINGHFKMMLMWERKGVDGAIDIEIHISDGN